MDTAGVFIVASNLILFDPPPTLIFPNLMSFSFPFLFNLPLTHLIFFPTNLILFAPPLTEEQNK